MRVNMDSRDMVQGVVNFLHRKDPQERANEGQATDVNDK